MKFIKVIKAKNKLIKNSTINDSNFKILYIYEDKYDGFPKYIVDEAKKILKQYGIKLNNIYISDTQEYTIEYSYNYNVSEDDLQDAFGNLYYSLEEIFERDNKKDLDENIQQEDWGF